MGLEVGGDGVGDQRRRTGNAWGEWGAPWWRGVGNKMEWGHWPAKWQKAPTGTSGHQTLLTSTPAATGDFAVHSVRH